MASAAGATADLCKDTANCPASAHSAYIGVYVFAPASRSDATPCQAIRSLQGPPYWGSVAPRRTFAAIAQNQRKSGAREKSEWKMTF